MCAKSLQSRLSLCNPKNYSPPGSCPRDSPGKNTGVDCHVLLQGIFPAQGSNPDPLCLLRWQVGSLPLVPLGKPRKQGGNGISFSTHEDHTHRSKKLSWLCEVVQSEGRHLPEETPCEHSEYCVGGSCSPFSIVTMLLFMVYSFQCIFHIKL